MAKVYVEGDNNKTFILGQFKEQEILVVKGRKVEVLNKKQLEQIARYG